jgi:uncharacterized repeat protein (TIGR01451 family)
MCKLGLVKWGGLSVGLALVLVLSLQGFSVDAAPPDPSSLGITPTPTSLPTAVLTPTPDTGVDVADPVIVKRGEPSEAVPGEEVVFTLEVTNQGQRAAVDVVVTDEVDQYLEIVEVTATQGTVLVEGQLITVDVGVVGPGFVVEIVIRTRVRPDAPVPLNVENAAQLKSPNGGDRVSPPVVISVPGTSYLPRTGGTPSFWYGAVLLLAVITVSAIGLARRELV